MSPVAKPRSTFTARYRALTSLLAEARKDAGLTQAALAARLHRPQSFVSKYERRERRLDVIEFLDVAAALRTDAFSLLARLVEKRR